MAAALWFGAGIVVGLVVSGAVLMAFACAGFHSDDDGPTLE